MIMFVVTEAWVPGSEPSPLRSIADEVMHFSMTSHHEIFDSAASSGMLGHLGGGTPQSAQSWQAFRTVLPLFSAPKPTLVPLKSRCCNILQGLYTEMFSYWLHSYFSPVQRHITSTGQETYNLGLFSHSLNIIVFQSLRYVQSGLVMPFEDSFHNPTLNSWWYHSVVFTNTSRLHCATSSEQVMTRLCPKWLLIYNN